MGIEVVAVNQPPVLFCPADIAGVEDTMVDVTGIRVTDPDVAEVITSRLAHLVRRPALDKSPRIVCVTPCLALKLAATQLSEPSSQWHPLSRSLHLLSSNSYPTFPAYPLASDTADSDSTSEPESADSDSETRTPRVRVC